MRNPINPPLNATFNEIYQLISMQPGSRTPELTTTGGVKFFAEAKLTRDGRKYISLPHNNRIYKGDWGYTTNSMGKNGQRIGQYSMPLDQWASVQ